MKGSHSLVVGFEGIFLFFALITIGTKAELPGAGQKDSVKTKISTFGVDNSSASVDTWDGGWEAIRRRFVYYLSGHDEDGRPIWVAEVGKWPTKEVVEAGGDLLANLSLFQDQMGQNVLNSIVDQNREGHPVSAEIIVIVDMEGYDVLKTSSISTIQYLRRKLIDLQPVARKIETGFLINMNFISESMVNVLRPVLGGVIAQFEVFGTNKERWLPRLLKRIPKSELPEWYGGSKTFQPLQIHG